MATIPGGLSERQDATEEVHEISGKMKPFAEKKTGRNFEIFNAIFHKTQVVAGTNYFIKVHVGDVEFVHLRVWKKLPHDREQLELYGVQTGKTFDDPIEYFQ
ncbi:Cystatin-B [Bagarius yarrelli]|uniref:Cystatin-B n=1 Tax=Bagarius yarrelli TaxID=175774 RepID=A0A556TWI1_BAGYA|nr:Cystatin-B [Bagarius yarrelli]